MNRLTEPDVDRYDVNPLREQEDARTREWEAFQATLHGYAERYGWSDVLWHAWAAYQSRSWNMSLHCDIRDFADVHGWPDTLRAIASALHADEQQKRELFNRR